MNLRKTVEELQNTPYASRKVVCVDELDNEIGTESLIKAHRDRGVKHRAFSLVLYRVRAGKKEILLQQRAVEKPVFVLLWTNTCCYNMAPGEIYLPRAAERAREEMGARVNQDVLRILYRLSYYAPDLEGWCENELDTVIAGEWDGKVELNPAEAADYRWMSLGELEEDMRGNPEIYAPWFKMIVTDLRFRNVFE